MPDRRLGHHFLPERQDPGPLGGPESRGRRKRGRDSWTEERLGVWGLGGARSACRDSWGLGHWGPRVTRCFLPSVKYNKGLSCSRVTILSPKECEVFYPGVITSNMMCAGLDQGQDPCQVQTGQGGSLTGGSGTGRLWENRHPLLPAQFPPHIQHYPTATPTSTPCSTLLPCVHLLMPNPVSKSTPKPVSPSCMRCSVMSDSATPWAIALQAPLSMEFPRQEYWSWLPFSSPNPFLPHPKPHLHPQAIPKRLGAKLFHSCPALCNPMDYSPLAPLSVGF